MEDKAKLRAALRAARRDHVTGLDPATRALVFLRPPATIAAMIPEGACVGLYQAIGSEASARGYARWFLENGRRIALPWFATRDAAMSEAMIFREWSDPFGDSDLEPCPYGFLQPSPEASAAIPDVLIVPLLGFTAAGDRIGQGAGHYDRWLAAHPGTRTIGLAWDCQRVESLPVERHDMPLDAIVTPTRIYERV